jgi:hypothetical protein
MDMNVEKVLQATIPNTDYERSNKSENVEYFSYLGSMILNNTRRMWEIKCRTAMAKAAFNRKKTFFRSKLNLNLRKKPVKCHIWSIALCSAETWTFQKVVRKCLEGFEMWCWRWMEKISWADHVRNEEVLQRGREERNIIYTVKRRKVDWIGHILCRNCLLKHVVEGKRGGRMEVMGRQGRRRMQLLDNLKENTGYWKLKKEALDDFCGELALEVAVDLS